MNKNILFIVILTSLIFTSIVSAQNQQVTIKKHYELSSTEANKDFTEFEQSINNFGELDQFRFLNQRRTINFSGSNVSIELFSASELLTLFGKEISPLTIMPGTFYKPVDFMITTNDDILTVFPLYIKQDPIQY
jgi:hypothetical protein